MVRKEPAEPAEMILLLKRVAERRYGKAPFGIPWSISGRRAARGQRLLLFWWMTSLARLTMQMASDDILKMLGLTKRSSS